VIKVESGIEISFSEIVSIFDFIIEEEDISEGKISIVSLLVSFIL
jgi:hypothetical protein